MGRKMESVAAGKNYTVGNLGALSAERLVEYEFPNPAGGGVIPGKVFLAESLGASGMEASLQVMPPDMGMPFFHKHRRNEELYIVLKGRGEFTVDGDSFPVMEGSAVRISPAGSRSWKNTGSEAMIVLCVQAVSGTLSAFTGSDGVLS